MTNRNETENETQILLLNDSENENKNTGGCIRELGNKSSGMSLLDCA